MCASQSYFVWSKSELYVMCGDNDSMRSLQVNLGTPTHPNAIQDMRGWP